MKKFYYVLMLILYAMGVIGGIGYACYNSAYPIAIGVIATGYMAWPTVKDYFFELFIKD